MWLRFKQRWKEDLYEGYVTTTMKHAFSNSFTSIYRVCITEHISNIFFCSAGCPCVTQHFHGESNSCLVSRLCRTNMLRQYLAWQMFSRFVQRWAYFWHLTAIFLLEHVIHQSAHTITRAIWNTFILLLAFLYFLESVSNSIHWINYRFVHIFVGRGINWV